MSTSNIEEKVQALYALRDSPERALPAIKTALAGRNNYVASKAAALAAELNLTALTEPLLAAFDRFMDDPAKSDPQCWAKNATAKALKDLGHTDDDVFRRGARHIQMEPVWGGEADTAGTLRGTCLLALIDCHLSDVVLLPLLADALADPEKPVRIDAAFGLARAGIPEAVAVLRLKALLGDEEPEVIGQCLASILELTPDEGVSFVQRFLSGKSELQVEAVAALAQSRANAALPTLKEFWSRRLAPEVRSAVHTILAASRHRAEFPPLEPKRR
jgi:HEAT repeat protein